MDYDKVIAKLRIKNEESEYKSVLLECKVEELQEEIAELKTHIKMLERANGEENIREERPEKDNDRYASEVEDL